MRAGYGVGVYGVGRRRRARKKGRKVLILAMMPGWMMVEEDVEGAWVACG